eukprot:6504835-Prorocentrum_lima.AAC.1
MRELTHAIVRLDTTWTQHLSALPSMPDPGDGTSPPVPVPYLPAHRSQTPGNYASGPVSRVNQTQRNFIPGLVTHDAQAQP